MKKLSLIVLAIMLLVPYGATARQDAFCFGLSEDDCELYQGGTGEFSSAHFTYDVFLYVAEGDQEIEIFSEGTGDFTINLEAQSFTDMLSLNLEMEITIEDQSVPLELRFIDGVVYVGSGGFWGYATFEEILDRSGFPIELFDLMLQEQVIEMGEDDEGVGKGAGVIEIMQGIGPIIEVLSKYIVATRGEDIEVQGKPVAFFTTSIDLEGLLSDKQIQKNLPGLVEGLPPEFGGGAEMAQILRMAMSMVGMMFEDVEIVIDNKIGIEDRLNYGFGIDLGFFIKAMAMSLLGTPTEESVEFILEFSVDLIDHDKQCDYDVPEGATKIPLK